MGSQWRIGTARTASNLPLTQLYFYPGPLIRILKKFVGEPNDEGGKTVTGLPAMIPIVFWFAWMILPEALLGATAGHEIMGLKVVSIDGGKISFGQSLKRRLCDAVEISWCFGFIAYILAKNTTRSQRLGDIWGQTLVIDKREGVDVIFEFETADVNKSR